MKKLAVLILLALAAVVSSCGTSTTPPTTTTSAGGNWEAVFVGGRGDASELTFLINFTVTNTNGGSTQTLTINNFSFVNQTACFVTGEGVSGTANLTTSNANQVTGTINITVTSGNPSGNVLKLTTGALSGTANNGTLTNGAATGTWTLQGGAGDASCNVPQGPNATFTLCQGAATCTVTT